MFRPSQRWRAWGGAGGAGGSPVIGCSAPQTQLPQQKLQLQEACMRKEKSAAVLEHQLLEVEVSGSARQGLGPRVGQELPA